MTFVIVCACVGVCLSLVVLAENMRRLIRQRDDLKEEVAALRRAWKIEMTYRTADADLHAKERRKALRLFAGIACLSFHGNPDGEAEWLRTVEAMTGWKFVELDEWEDEIADEIARAEEENA